MHSVVLLSNVARTKPSKLGDIFSKRDCISTLIIYFRFPAFYIIICLIYTLPYYIL